ncbi:sulfotransferase ssu-1-like [Ixodes scapularis]
MMERDRPAIQIIDGFRLPGFFSEEVYRSGLRYQPEDSDIILVTFPKCGTHWVLEIVKACFRVCRGVTPGWSFLEMHGLDGTLRADRPRIIFTHLPFHLAPFSPSTKYIYVARNPKDCCVSFYHHTKTYTDYCFQDGTFDEYFELFIEGLTDFGSYFENLLSWYAKKDEPNVLFLTYESIHADMKGSVLKMAGFIDGELAKELAEDEAKMTDIIDSTSMTEMVKDWGVQFVRKGVVGDWRNYFSKEQSERLKKKLFKEMKAGSSSEAAKTVSTAPCPSLAVILTTVQQEACTKLVPLTRMNLPSIRVDVVTPVQLFTQRRMMERDRPAIQIIDGFRLPGFFSEEVYRSGLRYQPEDSDIILVTFPKCGTHWVLEIVKACFRVCRGVTPGWSFLEMHGLDGTLRADRPRIIFTHLPFHLAPFSPSTKYIYVARNPKDCCVSFYHHTKTYTDYCFQDGTFDEYFELFIEGLTDFGSYFENLLSWYAKKDEPNVLFLTYESIHADMKGSVLKMAGFIDGELAKELAEDEAKMTDIIDSTSMTEMVKDWGVQFVRKGVVGDWRNYFSKEQSERLKKKLFKEMKGTSVLSLWDDLDWLLDRKEAA